MNNFKKRSSRDFFKKIKDEKENIDSLNFLKEIPQKPKINNYNKQNIKERNKQNLTYNDNKENIVCINLVENIENNEDINKNSKKKENIKEIDENELFDNFENMVNFNFSNNKNNSKLPNQIEIKKDLIKRFNEQKDIFKQVPTQKENSPTNLNEIENILIKCAENNKITSFLKENNNYKNNNNNNNINTNNNLKDNSNSINKQEKRCKTELDRILLRKNLPNKLPPKSNLLYQKYLHEKQNNISSFIRSKEKNEEKINKKKNVRNHSYLNSENNRVLQTRNTSFDYNRKSSNNSILEEIKKDLEFVRKSANNYKNSFEQKKNSSFSKLVAKSKDMENFFYPTNLMKKYIR